MMRVSTIYFYISSRGVVCNLISFALTAPGVHAHV